MNNIFRELTERAVAVMNKRYADGDPIPDGWAMVVVSPANNPEQVHTLRCYVEPRQPAQRGRRGFVYATRYTRNGGRISAADLRKWCDDYDVREVEAAKRP